MLRMRSLLAVRQEMLRFLVQRNANWIHWVYCVWHKIENFKVKFKRECIGGNWKHQGFKLCIQKRERVYC